MFSLLAYVRTLLTYADVFKGNTVVYRPSHCEASGKIRKGELA